MFRFQQRLSAYIQLMRFHRPIGGWLLLWPTLWALWAAKQPHAAIRNWPEAKLLLIFTAGVWIMRAAGCILNDLTDYPFDGKVIRTHSRPLITGIVSRKEAFSLFIILIAMALGLVLFLNKLTLLLAVIGLLLAGVYPWMKRCFDWPQLILGLAFAWSVPMAYTAQATPITYTAGLLFLSAILWPLAYDTIYAMMDQTDDRRLGLKSTAIWLENKGLAVSSFLTIIYVTILGLLTLIGLQLARCLPYYLSLLMATGCMIYQLYLIKKQETTAYLRAFENNHWIGLIIFLGFLFS
jgi:4-hydroxybenzoate polyprenyltransferase